MESETLTLFCWIRSQTKYRIFTIHVSENAFVGTLKKVIMDEKQVDLRGIEADDLDLYRIPCPEHVEDELKGWDPRDKAILNVRTRLSKLFSVSDAEKWLIVVDTPTLAIINCWVRGQNTRNVFSIRISNKETVEALKKAVKNEKRIDFRDVDADSLNLYLASNCTHDNIEETANRIDVDNPLYALTPLSNIFSVPPIEGCIHVIVFPPHGRVEAAKQDEDITILVETFRHTIENYGPTPSTAAKSFEYAKVQAGSRFILDCRFPAAKPLNTVGPPIQLFHPAFAYFSSKAHDPGYTIPDDFICSIRDLIYGFSQIYDKENNRGMNVNPILSRMLNRFLSHIVNYDRTSPDFVTHVSREGLPFYLIVGEEKKEFGDGGSDPSVQAGFSYLRLMCQQENKHILLRCSAPAFIIAHAGPWLSIMGGIINARCIVQRLTDFVWVPFHSSLDDGQCHQIARILYALKESIQRLDSWYENLQAAPFDTSKTTYHSRFSPSPDAYLDRDTKVKFAYQKPLNSGDVSCVTYLAKTVEDEPKDVVVKFVTSYGAEVHRHMASEGFAPRLLYYGTINVAPEMPSYGNLRMVVMDYVNGSTLHDALRRRESIPPSFIPDLQRALQHLHNAGYVFGDLRMPNVMVVPDTHASGSTAQLIDFDWAGKQGQVKYPTMISTNIQWAEGVKGLSLIEREHDEHMLKMLLRNCDRDGLNRLIEPTDLHPVNPDHDDQMPEKPSPKRSPSSLDILPHKLPKTSRRS